MNKISRAFGRRASAALVTVMLANQAMAQVASNPLTDALDSVDLAGVATKIAAAGLVIVAIALAFKGPDLAKRLTRKV